MNKLSTRFIAAILAAGAIVTSCGKDNDEKKPEPPVDKLSFSAIEMEGFTVKIRTYLENTLEAQNVLEHMRNDLAEINALIPEKALEVMKSKPIWLEKDLLPDQAAWYNAYLEYLEYHNYMTAKWKCVEINNYVNYFNWSRQNQPYMVLHELCHLYHDLALEDGFENAEILAAYNHAYDSGMYTGTPYCIDMRTTPWNTYNLAEGTRAYCMTDDQEYFAELCEAYWGVNDFYPFDWWDLKEYDPVGFELLEKIWGKRDLPETRPE